MYERQPTCSLEPPCCLYPGAHRVPGPDGRRSAPAHQSMWHADALILWPALQGHTDAIATLAWSPDDSMLATCGQDRILRLWSSEDGRCIQELSHHTQQVSAVAWLPDSECWVPAGSAPAPGADTAGLGCSTASADRPTASPGTAQVAGL